jgi:hypothetical protein
MLHRKGQKDCNVRNWGANSNQNVKKLTCSARGGSAEKQAGI